MAVGRGKGWLVPCPGGGGGGASGLRRILPKARKGLTGAAGTGLALPCAQAGDVIKTSKAIRASLRMP